MSFRSSSSPVLLVVLLIEGEEGQLKPDRAHLLGHVLAFWAEHDAVRLLDGVKTQFNCNETFFSNDNSNDLKGVAPLFFFIDCSFLLYVYVRLY